MHTDELQKYLDKVRQLGLEEPAKLALASTTKSVQMQHPPALLKTPVQHDVGSYNLTPAMRLKEEQFPAYQDRTDGSKAIDPFYNLAPPQITAGNIIGHKTHDLWGQRKLTQTFNEEASGSIMVRRQAS